MMEDTKDIFAFSMGEPSTDMIAWLWLIPFMHTQVVTHF